MEGGGGERAYRNSVGAVGPPVAVMGPGGGGGYGAVGPMGVLWGSRGFLMGAVGERLGAL